MDYFLKSIAKYLYNNYIDSFKDITLVFPNRRSGVFFQNELMRLVTDKPIWVPKIKTINEFMHKHSKLELASHIELLTQLYVVYKKVSNSKESFDNFYNWGEIILTDFNDIDKYLVDAKSLFINIKNLKDIDNNIDFLDEEQIDTLKRFFEAFDVDRNTEIKKAFAKIWEVMHPLYSEFKTGLETKKIGYEGMIYKDALNNIKLLQKNDYPCKKIFFIGFNAITPAEEEVFNILKNIEIAEFIWDFDEYYINNNQMEAGLFQRKYLKKFPPVNIGKNSNQLKDKKINIVSTPTNHGQVFSASQILETIEKKDISDTAVVLSDEQLLLPMLNNVPDNISDINVTMGYPITDSLTNNFIDFLIQAQQNTQTTKGRTSFYYKNVVSILKHPFVENLCPDTASDIIKKIISENIYQVDIKEFENDKFLKQTFEQINSTNDFFVYIERQINYLHEQLWLIENNDSFTLEKEFLFKLWLQTQTLHNQLIDSKIELQLPTYFNLLRKVIRTTRIPFDGEPIKGLQIMGFLETRNLDFKNIIITSVNEGVIPAQNKVASFIPFSLRRGFKLPTGELNDAMFAYYFYRILQSAENVWLIYNSGSSGMATSEKSRLIYQLEFDDNFKTNSTVFTQTIDVISNRNISIEKDDDVWSKLQEYLNTKDKKLSPSALSVYLQCPLQFYFKSIAKITEKDEITETVDARLFGNIFHNSAEKLYLKYVNDNTLITKDILKQILNNKDYIDDVIRDSFTKVFYGNKTKHIFKIEGKNKIIFDVIKRYLKQMIKKDIEYAPFSIVGLEYNVDTDININLGSSTANIKIGGQIDRIDRTDYALRIIDYKTGKDELKFKELDDVFNPEKISKTKAIFQTFMYSYIISTEFTDNKIVPMVYSIKGLFNKTSSFEISSDKCDTFQKDGFLGIKADVEEKIKQLLEEIFDINRPFEQTQNIKNCEYCIYKEMCGR